MDNQASYIFGYKTMDNPARHLFGYQTMDIKQGTYLDIKPCISSKAYLDIKLSWITQQGVYLDKKPWIYGKVYIWISNCGCLARYIFVYETMDNQASYIFGY